MGVRPDDVKKGDKERGNSFVTEIHRLVGLKKRNSYNEPNSCLGYLKNYFKNMLYNSKDYCYGRATKMLEHLYINSFPLTSSLPQICSLDQSSSLAVMISRKTESVLVAR